MNKLVFVVGEDRTDVSEILGRLWRNNIPAMAVQQFLYYLPEADTLQTLLVHCDVALFIDEWVKSQQSRMLHQFALDAKLQIFYSADNLITALK